MEKGNSNLKKEGRIMLTEITEGIQRLIVTFPMGMGDVNSYLIEGENGYTVIDTGANLDEAVEIWKDVLDTGIKIEKVVITHTHEDHVGLARWFQETVGVPVAIPKISMKEMEKALNQDLEQVRAYIKKYDGPNLPNFYFENKRIFAFQPDETFENHQKIKLGDDLYETIWTPGHAYDHFCFYNKEKNVLIVGDHVLKDVSPVVGVWTAEEEGNPLQDYFQSLEVIKGYSPKIALTGHGEPIYEFKKRVTELQERHMMRLEEVHAAVKDEYKTVKQVCEEIYGTMNIIIDLSAFMATFTRLIYLENIKRVDRKKINGKVFFKARKEE
ncbi:MBL fold metallo-hydrolase [Oceanobacillus caeni]|uniref:MBL fold metallo-hydrolase n=1 Tax=Oceanobacillus TaxID=182709 RepID=UPI00069A6FD0|nr:MBL fold metallo-hydrolase [Oceanobacillus caeni]MCR1835899.1 MBL fold metallo-hydrolase [Oceanobacillus caeni]